MPTDSFAGLRDTLSATQDGDANEFRGRFVPGNSRWKGLAFLDEPTLGLDVESSVELQREIRRLADQEDMTIVLSSHDMDVVERVCDRVVSMNDGRVVAGDTVEDLVDVFRSHAYAVTLDSALADRERVFLQVLDDERSEGGGKR